MGNVLVLLHLHRCDRQEATNQWKTKKLVNKPKQELQRDLWTNVSTNITNTTTCEKLRSDNGKQRIRKIALRELSTNSSTSLITRWKQETPVWSLTNLDSKRDSVRLRANGRNIVGQQLPILLHVTCCIRLHTLLYVVGCCGVLLRKVWNRSNFSSNNSQHFFFPWSSKRSATMLDPFAQLFPHCWGRARALRMFYKDFWVDSFPRCTAGSNVVGSCCIRLHTTANTHATTPIIVGATMLGVVASVSTQP